MKGNFFWIFILLGVFQIAVSRPRSQHLNVKADGNSGVKVREKRKFEIPLMRQLEEGGVGIKRNVQQKEGGHQENQAEVATLEKKPEKDTENKTPEVPPTVEDDDKGGPRIKKQSPNNLGGCGKTVCGPFVSARGPVASDMRAMLQAGKPMMQMPGLGSSTVLRDLSEAMKLENLNQQTPIQARTIDTLMGISPLSLASLGSLGYGTPASLSASAAAPAVSADTSAFGHSFFKPQTMPAMPVAVIAQHPPHSAIHPWLLPHLMPHLLPHLMPQIGSYFTPHRFEFQRYPEVVQTDAKQPIPVPLPVPAYAAPAFVNADNALLCQPFRNQKLESPYEYVYKPDGLNDKSLNVSDSAKRSGGAEEERKMHEHLKKVNEIKDEISQLNRAAQRIIDEQEKLTQMQQKQLWGSSSASSTMHGMQGTTSTQMTSPYMGNGYFAHPSMPWGYSRSNILSYPNSHDDIDFFMNLLRTGKKIGLINDSYQSNMMSPITETMKGEQDAEKTQKNAGDDGKIRGLMNDAKINLKQVKDMNN